MNNYLFLLPLYNDWESLLILHEKINDQMGKLKKRGKILIINDFSNNEPPIFKKYENIDKGNDTVIDSDNLKSTFSHTTLPKKIVTLNIFSWYDIIYILIIIINTTSYFI